MLDHLRASLCELPLPADLAQPVSSGLLAEFRAMPLGKRVQLYRKVALRELSLRLSGQTRLLRESVPHDTRRLLWWYSWPTIGDSLMDLSARGLIPASIHVDLLIAPSLAPLYATDPRFDRVFTRAEDVPPGHDFLLVHHLGTEQIRGKLRFWPSLPFAHVRGHINGEMFARVPFIHARFRQLFGLPEAPPQPPTLSLMPTSSGDRVEVSVAVALGARDPRRSVDFWPGLLVAIAERFAARGWRVRWQLFGSDNAQEDRARLPVEVLNQADDHVARLSLLQTAQRIAGCDAFVGPDGGLMHIAAASRLPGAALFTTVAPEYRLLPESSLRPWRLPVTVSAVADALVQDVCSSRPPALIA